MTLIWKLPQNSEPIAKDAKIGYKFSKDIFLLESFLKQKNISYNPNELEDSPFGKGIRIKRDNHDPSKEQPSIESI